MSISVFATPFLLLPAFISVAQAVAATAGITRTASSVINKNSETIVEEEQNYKVMNEKIKQLLKNSDGKVTQEIVNLLCREYDTVFVNKEVLIKTLQEHGAQNIYEENDNISCELEGFLLDFYKAQTENDMAFPPYKMKITTNCSENELQNFVENINSEYTSNTQEENYIKIKDRLDKQNMRIAEEEVYDDNTIVLTVNID